MLIIWGTKVRYENEGRGALFCPLCRDIMPMKIDSIYKVSHLYYIPLGSGDQVGSRAVCPDCGTWFEPPKRVTRNCVKKVGGDFGDFVAESNPDYLENLGEKVALEHRVRAAPQSLSEEDRALLTLSPVIGATGGLIGNDSSDTLRVVGVILGIGGVLVTPLICYLAAHSRPYADHTSLWVISILAVLFGGGLATVCFYLAARIGRKPKMIRRVARALAPVNPSLELVDAALSWAQSKGLASGNLCTPARLHAEIQLAIEKQRAGDPEYPPLSRNYEAILGEVQAAQRNQEAAAAEGAAAIDPPTPAAVKPADEWDEPQPNPRRRR